MLCPQFQIHTQKAFKIMFLHVLTKAFGTDGRIERLKDGQRHPLIEMLDASKK